MCGWPGKLILLPWLALLVVSQSRGQQPSQYYGITLAERQAIRLANQIKPKWMPTLSPNIKSLLLDRTDQEVVQISVVNSTDWYCRSETRRKMKLEETGTSADLDQLVTAMDDQFFKYVLGHPVAKVSALVGFPS